MKNQTLQKVPHFIGLGGAGCNALEYICKIGIYGKYTCIDFPGKRRKLFDEINYIDYKSPMQRNKIPLWLEPNKANLTEEIEDILTGNYQFVLLVGVGGHTGTALVSAISEMLKNETKTFLTICFIPFILERERTKVADKAKAFFKAIPNVHLIENTKLAENFKHLKLEGAFMEANKMTFEIYKDNIKFFSIKEVVYEYFFGFFRRLRYGLLT